MSELIVRCFVMSFVKLFVFQGLSRKGVDVCQDLLFDRAGAIAYGQCLSHLNFDCEMALIFVTSSLPFKFDMLLKYSSILCHSNCYP